MNYPYFLIQSNGFRVRCSSWAKVKVVRRSGRTMWVLAGLNTRK